MYRKQEKNKIKRIRVSGHEYACASQLYAYAHYEYAHMCMKHAYAYTHIHT